jgi:spermidine synthase
VTTPSATHAQTAPATGDRLPMSPRWARRLILFSTLLCAICGFVYELVIVAMGTVLIGSSTVQTAMVLGTFVAAMGVGSWIATKLPERRPVESFVIVEAAVALLGGVSAMTLFAAYAYLGVYEPVVRALSIVLGVLVGAEIPLLTAIIQRIRSEQADKTIGTLLAADYIGAFVVGLAFPLWILPTVGKIDAALLFGAVNVIGGAMVLWLMRRHVSRPALGWLSAAMACVLAALGLAAVKASAFEVNTRQALYDDPIALTEQTRYQEITITRSLDGRDTRLFLNGDLQFSSVDEYRYHESLVHPAMAGPRERALILGGGDGLAMREVLKYPDVREAVEVELDPRMVQIARTDPTLRKLNGDSLSDPRVRVVTADAFTWLRETSERFDVIIADFPDPDGDDLAKLYSQEIYGMIARRHLTAQGRVVVQSGSPYFAPEAFWAIDATVRAAGLETTPYHVDVPSFGDWGYVLAQAGAAPDLRLDTPRKLRFMDDRTLDAAAVFAPDRSRDAYPVKPNTLNRPTIIDYSRRGWKDE